MPLATLRLDAFEERSPRGIAGVIARLVHEGVLAPGDRLPTVRELAAELQVSPATVSAAWQALARAGVIVSRGRSGSFVRAVAGSWLTPRIQGLAAQDAGRDLSRGTPDPALLPALEPAFARVRPRASTGRYHDAPVLPELGRLLEESWPGPVESITVVDGALDGISRTLEQVVRFGDRVVVESPGFPYFFDLVEAVGAQAVPVPVDAEGMLPGALARALQKHPAAVLLQPRAQNPTGASMSHVRAQRLAGVIGDAGDARRAIVIEDDHSGPIAMAPDVSLARWLPNQVVHVRSYSKSHGPDLRIGALGGPARIVERIVARRMLGPGWTSRILQSVLVDLLTDEAASARVRHARLVYRDRADALASALRKRGVEVGAPDGINAWVPVRDQRAALVHLAAAGVAVAAGEPFFADADAAAPHVRVTAGLLDGPVDPVAEALAAASAAAPL